MNLLNLARKGKHFLGWMQSAFPLRKELGYCADNVQLNYPIRITTPKNVFIYENCRIQHDASIINAANEKVVIKKYSVVTAYTTIVPGNHKSTTTIPQFLLGAAHVNDQSTNIIIEEDCWVGTGAKLLAGTHLGRGCIVGAGSIVNKEVPPYALVVGSPAKIVAVKFSLEQILEHEKALYPEKERFSEDYLENLFNKYYEGKKVYGVSFNLEGQTGLLLDHLKKKLNYTES